MAVNAVGDEPLVRGGSRQGISQYVTEVALGGANPTPINTPFTRVVGVNWMVKSNVAPVAANSGLGVTLTYDIVGNVVNVYAWQATSITNPTLVASAVTTTFTIVVYGVH